MIKKIGIAIGILLVVLMVVFFLLNLWTKSILNREYDSIEKKMGEGESQALIIYQPSKGKTTQNQAELITKELTQNGYTVTLNVPALDKKYQMEEYELIVFISPVYFGTVSDTLEEYAKDLKINNKKVIVNVTGQFVDETKELKEMKKWFNKTNAVYGLKTHNNSITDVKKAIQEIKKS